MHLTHLSLTNFRNYRRLELPLEPGPVLIHGRNAQGKTNLLEAVFYLATTRSPHAETDQQLLNWETVDLEEPIAVGRLTADVQGRTEVSRVEMRLIRERRTEYGSFSFRREALVNRRKVRLMDLLGHIRATLFLPEDIQLVTGPPSGRRRYADITLCQTDRHYCQTLSSFNKILEQRNALLRQIAETGSGRDLLPVFTEKLAGLGAEILSRRASFFHALSREASRIHYEQLTDGQETIRLQYLPSLESPRPGRNRDDSEAIADLETIAEWLESREAVNIVADRYRASLEEGMEQDIARTSTRLGPHRDDWFFQVNGRPLGSYGSRGQQRSAILALKLAEIRWIEAQTGEMPVLLLDEVVAELDARRRELLLDVMDQAEQALLTATDPAMFTARFLARARALEVVNGRVEAGHL
jgi:DNA replication and repair protein RecF